MVRCGIVVSSDVVLAQKVSKVYHLYRRPSDRIFESLPFFKTKLHSDFWALRDVSLAVEKGETLGVVGPNGSGKSTLLQIISGIVQPTSGRVSAEGRIAALLELGAGFNPEFTGRENVYLNSEIMGLSRWKIDRVFPRIERFAEIGEFMERPVKEYSSGMYVRLAFATAIHVDPEILIVDEALAVGDAIFANRCMQKFEELKRRQVTILFVSHDLGLVKQLADRAILMVDGRIHAEGRPSDVINRYVGLVLETQRADTSPPTKNGEALTSSYQHGDGASRIVEVLLLNAEGNKTNVLRTGERLTVRIRTRFEREVRDPVVGILIRNRLGFDVFGTNTRIENEPLGTFRLGDVLQIDFGFDCFFTRQEYTLTVATQYMDGTSQDWLDDMVGFSVIDAKDTAGVVSVKTQITWQRTGAA